jgi:hypothetical protein
MTKRRGVYYALSLKSINFSGKVIRVCPEMDEETEAEVGLSARTREMGACSNAGGLSAV